MVTSSIIISCFLVLVIVKTIPTQSLPTTGRNLFHKRTADEEYMLNWNLPQLMAFKNRFEKFMDTDKNGKASFDEVKRFLKLYSPDISDENVNKFISRRDTNGDKEVEFIPEYLVHITLPDYTPEGADEWFKLEDRNHDGIITRNELLAVARSLGLNPAEVRQTVDGYYMSVDTNGDKQLDWEEYKRLYMP